MPSVSHCTRNRMTSASTRLTSVKSSTRSHACSARTSSRSCGSCSAAIRPLMISLAVPDATTRLILSMETEMGCLGPWVRDVSGLDEGQQVRVDDVRVGRAHAVRELLVDLERALLQQL